MGTIVDSLLWVLQDLYHQPQKKGALLHPRHEPIPEGQRLDAVGGNRAEEVRIVILRTGFVFFQGLGFRA